MNPRAMNQRAKHPRQPGSIESDSNSSDSESRTFDIDLGLLSDEQINLVKSGPHSQSKGSKRLVISTTSFDAGAQENSSRGKKTPRSGIDDTTTPLTPIAFYTPPNSPNETKAGLFSVGLSPFKI